MIWEEALELAVAQTGHERFRILCADSWPDHESYRRVVLRLAGAPDPPEPDHIRAARLIAEHPPDPTDRRCCNG